MMRVLPAATPPAGTSSMIVPPAAARELTPNVTVLTWLMVWAATGAAASARIAESPARRAPGTFIEHPPEAAGKARLTGSTLRVQPVKQHRHALGLDRQGREVRGLLDGVAAGALHAQAVEGHVDPAGHEGDVGGAGLVGVRGLDRAEAQVAAGPVGEPQQALVALGRRHRRVTLLEGELGGSVRQIRGGDLAHAPVSALELLGRDGAQVARHHGVAGDDVGLAESGAAELHRIELDRGAAEHNAGIERQVRLARQLAPETV